jgi:hypothetical protein
METVERLHKMMLKCCLEFVVLSVAPLVAAQDYCSLTVRVTAPNGRVAVSVVEKNGRIQEQDQENSDLRFCDLGGLPVTVKVGEDDPVPCLHDLPRSPVPTCRIVFRVKDSTGEWVHGATINIAEPITKELRTDRFGRSSLLIKLGDSVTGNAINQQASANFKYQCRLGESVHEIHLSLPKP